MEINMREEFSTMSNPDFIYCCDLIDERRTEELVDFVSAHPELIANNYSGTSLMHYSALYGDEETIMALYDLGSPVDHQDVLGAIPMHLAFYYGSADSLKNTAVLESLLPEEYKVDSASYLELLSFYGIHKEGLLNDVSQFYENPSAKGYDLVSPFDSMDYFEATSQESFNTAFAASFDVAALESYYVEANNNSINNTTNNNSIYIENLEVNFISFNF